MSDENDKIEIGVNPATGAPGVTVSGLSKIIKTTGEFVGPITRPIEKYLDAKADAIALITKTKAEVEAAKIALEGRIELMEIAGRAQERFGKELIRKQINREVITLNAMQSIPENVPNDPVDRDWLASFYSISEDVSNADMQTIWGKILAGEISKPGSFSQRTLQLVKTLKKFEADLFTKFCAYVWHEKNTDGTIKSTFHLRITSDSDSSTDDYLFKSGISLGSTLHLDHIGLIRFDLSFKIQCAGNEGIGFHGNEYAFIFPGKGVHFSAFSLTGIGIELLPICGAQANLDYEKRILELFKSNGAKLE